MSEHFDVAIVGGGPGGSNASREIKERNPDKEVVLFERGDEPTANCAGGIGVQFYKHMGFKPPKECVKSPIEDVAVASPNHEVRFGVDDVDTSSVGWLDGTEELGWVVDRQAWDNYQLGLAEENGADVRTKHTVKSIEQNGGSVNLSVLDRRENSEISVKADYVILANGANWKLAEQAGFDQDNLEPPKSELSMGLQYEFKDPDFIEEYTDSAVYIEFNRDYAPNGYTWSFSAGDGYTKWGAGIPLSHNDSVKERLHQYLEDHDKMEMKESSTRKTTNAIIPTAHPLNSCVEGNVMLVGDTAHHCDPLHGGGMMFGTRASKQAAKAISSDDMSLYDELWKDDFLDTLQNRFILRDLIHNMDNSEYDRFVKSLEGFEVTGVNPDVQIPRMMWHSLKNDAGIFTKSAKEATKSMARQKFASYLG